MRGHTGDLARSVTHRRTELGLSTEELARRAGIDAWFLAYFEQSSETNLSGGALLRLAVALSTTPHALDSGEVDRPPRPRRVGPSAVLETLSTDECERHLGVGGVGRIIFAAEERPVVLPVKFVFSNGLVVFKTSELLARTIVGHDPVAFEVDRIDEATSEGWSVLVRGHARQIEDAGGQRRPASLDFEPWAGGPRHVLVAIVPLELTGRGIVQRLSPDQSSSTDQN
jgi:transcriptional regulator with XRE-family HTH domain